MDEFSHNKPEDIALNMKIQTLIGQAAELATQ